MASWNYSKIINKSFLFCDIFNAFGSSFSFFIYIAIHITWIAFKEWHQGTSLKLTCHGRSWWMKCLVLFSCSSSWYFWKAFSQIKIKFWRLRRKTHLHLCVATVDESFIELIFTLFNLEFIAAKWTLSIEEIKATPYLMSTWSVHLQNDI